MRPLVTPLLLLALTVPFAARAHSEKAPLDREIRELTAAVERLVATLEAEVEERRGTETILQLGEIDRMILAMEAELRQRHEARDEAVGEVRDLETAIAETREKLDAIERPESEIASLIASAGGTITVDRLDVALDDDRRRLADAQARVVRLEAEVVDLENTLQARRALRARIEKRLE